MSSTFGEKVKVTIFGQSHSEAIGVCIDGLPAGIKIDMEKLDLFLRRRNPDTKWTTQRKENISPRFICGLINNTTCGDPITALLKNEDIDNNPYKKIKTTPRPGHADLTNHIKNKGFEDSNGGGHSSGRLTAALCVAGGIIIQVLESKGIKISSKIIEIGGFECDFETILNKALVIGDSVGGIVECEIQGFPAGIGDPIFNGLENKISQAVFGVPAVKGIEFGNGFESAKIFGSENNDAIYYENDEVKTKTNNHGGILGGISSGMPIIFKTAIKPTPSIPRIQQTINYETKKNEPLLIGGRHDTCIALRIGPCIESAAAIALINFL